MYQLTIPFARVHRGAQKSLLKMIEIFKASEQEKKDLQRTISNLTDDVQNLEDRMAQLRRNHVMAIGKVQKECRV